jgi:hypothetical protein
VVLAAVDLLDADRLNVGHLVAGLLAGGAVLAVCSRPGTRRAYPAVATAAVVLVVAASSRSLELTAAIGAAAVVATAATGWGAWRLARADGARALAVAAVAGLVGAWLAVPDTEAVLAAAGVVLPAAAVALVRRPVVADLPGWPLLAAALVGVTAASSAGDLAVAVGALGCLGLLAVAPLAGLVDPGAVAVVDLRRWSPPAVTALAVAAASVVLCARVATRAERAGDAALLVVGVWLVSAVVLSVAGRALRRRAPTP